MNFDGKAFVKNVTVKNFISEHGYAFVREQAALSINHFCFAKDRDEAIVIPTYMTNQNVLNNSTFYCVNGLIPHSVQVYNKEVAHVLNPQRFINVREISVQRIQDSFKYEQKRIYVSRLQPTNIKYNAKSAIVIDSEQKESALSFAGTSVNVNSKVQVVIPEKITDYSDMSIVVQKNCFIEIKLSDSVIDVTNIPDALMYLPGYIKGTFTQSGEYNIKIKHPDGEQIINIVVPYYQRLL